MREAGKWTGFVGDLGFGLTKPVSLATGFSGWGFLLALAAVGRVSEEGPVLDAGLVSFLGAGLS
jgi:hypothetical protein